MHNLKIYDCAIIGGGIAGLSLSIQLARIGYEVIVFEKNSYPFHKVCGEYISNESHDFFKALGLPLEKWDLPQIRSLGISSERGFMMNSPLLLGGFGISRFKLDYELAMTARSLGVTVMDNTRVNAVNEYTVATNKGIVSAKFIAGCFGKSKPIFAGKTQARTPEKYIGVKYHITADFPVDRIELHNFSKGYCGISKIEAERYCLCYLSSVENLKACNNSIPEMEERIVKKNPFLKKIFDTANFIFERPVTISDISFDARKTSDEKMLYLGDAAGCISPLTGNGMSMAALSSVFVAGLADQFLRKKISKQEVSVRYAAVWNKEFLSRIRRGKQLQYLFGKNTLSHLALKLLDPMSGVKSRVIASTHGRPFQML